MTVLVFWLCKFRKFRFGLGRMSWWVENWPGLQMWIFPNLNTHGGLSSVVLRNSFFSLRIFRACGKSEAGLGKDWSTWMLPTPSSNVVKHNPWFKWLTQAIRSVVFTSAWLGLPGDGWKVHRSGDFGRELLMPVVIGLVDWLDSDFHLGDFNQHLQWFQSPLRAPVTLSNCCLFYITVSLLFSVAVFSTYSSTVKGYVVLRLLYLLR